MLEWRRSEWHLAEIDTNQLCRLVCRQREIERRRDFSEQILNGSSNRVQRAEDCDGSNHGQYATQASAKRNHPEGHIEKYLKGFEEHRHHDSYVLKVKVPVPIHVAKCHPRVAIFIGRLIGCVMRRGLCSGMLGGRRRRRRW